MPKGIVISDEFDWKGDKPLNRPLRFSVIYETHVRGLTLHPSSGVAHPGTFRGVTEKIPYFTELGITSLELLPVQEFDELENTRVNPVTGERLQNYWGYNTITFFAPKGRYSSAGALGQQVTEFKEMVRELHAAGIEVILDMVFNHSAEGDESGPTLCFRGWDNSIYYMLDEKDPRRYRNFTGCGNTMNCNHPIVRSLIAGLPALLGDGDARGRLPLRSRLGAGPGPGRQPDGKPARPGAHRGGPGSAAHEDHCRGVGRGRRIPGGMVPRRQVGGVERQVPRRRAQVLARGWGDGRPPGDTRRGQLGPVPA